MVRFSLTLALALAALNAPLFAEMKFVAPETLAPVAIDTPIVTHHVGTFSGRKVAYQAMVEPFVTADLAGKPATRLIATSYIADKADSARPVMFVFNGGPIGATAPLHMGLFGPKRIAVPDGGPIGATAPLHMGLFGPKRIAVPDDITRDPSTFKQVDNVYSPLDIVDIVIFDPASTGYSRMLPGVDPHSQFTTAEDSRQLAQLVGLWVKAHHRTGAPLYLVGESYGTLRAPEAAHQLQGTATPISGLFLLGQAANIIEYAQRRDNIVSYAVSLPTLAAIGWWHGKVVREGRTFDQFIKDAQDYGAGEYLSVLFLGNRAPAERRRAVAAKLQDFTGLPAETFLKADLKVAKTQYQRELLPGKVLDTNDARYAVSSGRTGASPDYGQSAQDYFHDFLAVPVAAGVYSVDIPTGGLNSWNWDAQKSPFGDWPWVGYLRQLMTDDPKFRLFVGNGYYDTQTTLGAMDYLVAQSGLPQNRVRTRYFQGGHMMYTVEASAKALSGEIHDMVAHRW